MSREDSPATSSYSDLQLAYRRLLALERFKSGFLARTSHELRSPINTIVSLHQLILEDLCEGPEEEKEFIQQSKGAALKMLELFDRVAAVSKLDVGREPPKLEAVDLSFLLPEIEMLIALQAANQNVRYSVESPEDELKIHTDGRWLKNVLTSLIQDAIPHTKQLRLFILPTAEGVSVGIECDRSAKSLTQKLNAIEEAVNIQSEPTPPATAKQARKYPTPDELELSTGLVLATAQTALPAINGEFAIKAADAGSHLICKFSRA